MLTDLKTAAIRANKSIVGSTLSLKLHPKRCEFRSRSSSGSSVLVPLFVKVDELQVKASTVFLHESINDAQHARAFGRDNRHSLAKRRASNGWAKVSPSACRRARIGKEDKMNAR